MLRQRLLAAVTVKAGRAVQSMGYKRYLPLGDVACVVENLDRWGADGIVVLSIDQQLEGPDLKLLKRLSQLQLSTPLTYGGGIRTAAEALAAVQSGAERLVIDRALGESSEHIAAMAAAVGRQALIASIPLRRDPDGAVQHWEYWQQASHSLNAWLQSSQWQRHVSEVLAIDVTADGSLKGPDPSLWPALKQLGLPLLAYGGFSQADQIESILKQPGVAAAVIGNALNYQEDSIRMLKDQLSGLPLRPHPSHPSFTNH